MTDIGSGCTPQVYSSASVLVLLVLVLVHLFCACHILDIIAINKWHTNKKIDRDKSSTRLLVEREPNGSTNWRKASLLGQKRLLVLLF